MSGGNPVGEWLGLSLTLAFFVGIFWLAWRSRRAKRHKDPVPDGPENEAYGVYTDEFDREFAGRELDRELLAASPEYASGWFKIGKDHWRREIQLADQLAEEQRPQVQRELCNASIFQNSAVTFLIDQSGSMKDDPMRWVAVSCQLAAEILAQHGCEVEVLGFSTAGWRGGFAYQKWVSSGRPKRPGRLCALLHVIYKSVNQPELYRADWEALLNPNVLRENVDGEALEWASGRLRKSMNPRRYLIVLSDGAPVDDATLMHNGLSYLARHLKLVIGELQRDSNINLSAIGIRHAVSEYYENSITVEDLTQIPVVVAKWLSLRCQTADSAPAK